MPETPICYRKEKRQSYAHSINLDKPLQIKCDLSGALNL